MRRIVILLTVVALMVGMLAMSVAPASAAGLLRCYDPSAGVYRIVLSNEAHIYKVELGYTNCRGLNAPVA